MYRTREFQHVKVMFKFLPAPVPRLASRFLGFRRFRTMKEKVDIYLNKMKE